MKQTTKLSLFLFISYLITLILETSFFSIFPFKIDGVRIFHTRIMIADIVRLVIIVGCLVGSLYILINRCKNVENNRKVNKKEKVICVLCMILTILLLIVLVYSLIEKLINFFQEKDKIKGNSRTKSLISILCSIITIIGYIIVIKDWYYLKKLISNEPVFDDNTNQKVVNVNQTQNNMTGTNINPQNNNQAPNVSF